MSRSANTEQTNAEQRTIRRIQRTASTLHELAYKTSERKRSPVTMTSEVNLSYNELHMIEKCN
jgi:hypothetical protein